MSLAVGNMNQRMVVHAGCEEAGEATLLPRAAPLSNFLQEGGEDAASLCLPLSDTLESYTQKQTPIAFS